MIFRYRYRFIPIIMTQTARIKNTTVVQNIIIKTVSSYITRNCIYLAIVYINILLYRYYII